EIDVGRPQREITQERVDGETRIAGVVLQAREALLRGAGDDLAVAEDRRRRAVRLADPENDQRRALTTSATSSRRTCRPAAASPARRRRDTSRRPGRAR